MDSDDEIESERESAEQNDNLDHLTLAERIALKRKAEGELDEGERRLMILFYQLTIILTSFSHEIDRYFKIDIISIIKIGIMYHFY